MSKTYQQDNMTIHNADCMEVMAGYEDNYFDLAVVDPPYGISINKSGRLGHYGGKGKTWDNSVPDEAYFNELERVSKNRIIWGGNYFSMPPTRCFLIWDKKQPEALSFASCELAWTSFDQSAKTYYKSPINADNERIHPTQKPVTLYDWIYANYAEEGQKILDTHLGSGSNAIAAHYAKMSEFVGCELDEDYYKASIERIRKETRQLELF